MKRISSFQSKIDGISSLISTGQNTWQISVVGTKDIRMEISQLATHSGHSILTMTRKEQKLEDIFKILTKSSSQTMTSNAEE